MISSLTPSEYMSAVSKKVTPASTAFLTSGSPCSSGSIHAREAGLP